jgi:hypothetical protein
MLIPDFAIEFLIYVKAYSGFGVITSKSGKLVKEEYS